MAAQNIQNVCLFYKFGYCKHNDCCRKQHVKKVCDNNTCEISKCSFRHPKICKFYRDNGQCKFDPCMFKHVNSKSEIENMQIKLNIMEEKLDKVLEITNFVDKFDSLEKQIREKDLQIENLQKTIEILETKITKCIENNVIEKSKEDNYNVEKFEKIDYLADSLKSMERKVYVLEKINVGVDFCEYCDSEFTTSSEKKIHIRNTHTFECDICELRLKNKEDLEIHFLTCEIYICVGCQYRHKRLSEMKNHSRSKHEEKTYIFHYKMDRETFTEITSTEHRSDEI